MGHHIDSQGRFQSDKHPDLAPDKIIVSFKDPLARKALRALASSYAGTDNELAKDILDRLESIAKDGSGAF